MASHKALQGVGLAALCGHIKGIRKTAEQTSSAVIQISEALQSFSAEVEGLINELDTKLDNLTTAIIAGNVPDLQDSAAETNE